MFIHMIPDCVKKVPWLTNKDVVATGSKGAIRH